MSGEGGTQEAPNQSKGRPLCLENYAIAPSPKPTKEMMITTTLAPIPEAQSTESNSVTSLRLAYQEAKIDYSILEQQIRNTPIDQFNLLVQLNEKLLDGLYTCSALP